MQMLDQDMESSSEPEESDYVPDESMDDDTSDK